MKTVPGQTMTNATLEYGSIVARTWCYAIAVECFLVRQFLAFAFCFLTDFLGLLGCAESTTSLLIHFCSGSNTIDSHKEELLWLDLAEQHVDIGEY
jgi:hypothetical protein